MHERDFIAGLRGLAGHPAARGLADDAAVLEFGGRKLVLTHDMIVEGVHFLPSDPLEDVAWKLVAVNLSDLAGKGARPIGVLVGYSLSPAAGGDEAFLEGLGAALTAHQSALLGGDTVSAPPGAPRAFGLTAIGEAGPVAPSRAGAQPGDLLWVSGTIGDAGAGLRVAIGELEGPASLVDRYRRPEPRLALGQRLASIVHAMMDVSDGLLIDAARMAAASGVALDIDLARIPLSGALISTLGDGRQVRIEAAIAGDDYELLFAAPEDRSEEIAAISVAAGVAATCIGRFGSGGGLTLTDNGSAVQMPERLGYEHDGA